MNLKEKAMCMYKISAISSQMKHLDIPAAVIK